MKNEREKSPSLVAKRPANKPEIAEVDLLCERPTA